MRNYKFLGVAAAMLVGMLLHERRAEAQVLPRLICRTPTDKVTSVGTTATKCPAAQIPNRTILVLCNSSENTGNPLIKIRIDGAVPVMGITNPGLVLAKGQCVTEYIASDVIPYCISDTASTAVSSTECS